MDFSIFSTKVCEKIESQVDTAGNTQNPNVIIARQSCRLAAFSARLVINISLSGDRFSCDTAPGQPVY